MRRLMVLPIAGLLVLAIVVPAAAGSNVHNTSGGGRTIYGEWFGEGGYGYVMLGQESGSAGWGDVYQESGEYVLCDTDASIVIQDTSPGEEFYGFQGTRVWGFAYDVTIDFSRRLESGTASGQVELYTETIDECAGVYGGDPSVENGSLEVRLTAQGPLASFRGSGSYKIPSEFNGHTNYRGKELQAGGTVVAGSAIDAAFEFALMTEYTWTEHVNH